MGAGCLRSYIWVGMGEGGWGQSGARGAWGKGAEQGGSRQEDGRGAGRGGGGGGGEGEGGEVPNVTHSGHS